MHFTCFCLAIKTSLLNHIDGIDSLRLFWLCDLSLSFIFFVFNRHSMWFTSPLIGPVAVAVCWCSSYCCRVLCTGSLDLLLCRLHMKWFYEISSQMISWKRHFVGVGVKWRRTQIGHSIIKFVSHKSSIPTSESCKQDWMKIDWIWLSFLLEIYVLLNRRV